MKKKYLVILLTGMMIFGMIGMAQATIWTDTNSITSGGAGSVAYSYFTLDADSPTVIQTFTNNFDPYMYLFYADGSLDSGDYIASDDDSGVPSAYGWYNSRISRTLSSGSYIAAVADYILTLPDAVSGINTRNNWLGIGYGSYTLQVNALTADVTETSSVPEPATLLLIGSGLVGLGFMRRKFKA